jgi:glycerol-3-phosphate dehydrogenase (NAD(P)+)
MKTIATIGAGNWGTALASTFAQLGHSVTLWAYEAEVVESIRTRHENEIFMPGVKLPKNLSATSDLGKALAGAEIVVTVMPSHVCGTIYQQMLPHLRSDMIFVSATKGIDTVRLMRMSEVIDTVVGKSFSPRLCVLSGPSFAKEVALGDPTAVVVASAALYVKRRRRSRVGWVGKKRYCRRRRRGRRAGAGTQSHRRTDYSRPRRNDSSRLRLRS